MHINHSWCRNTELNDIETAILGAAESFITKRSSGVKNAKPLSPEAKFQVFIEVMHDIANVMQGLGAETFNAMMLALTTFRDRAVKAEVPVFTEDMNFQGGRVPRR